MIRRSFAALAVSLALATFPGACTQAAGQEQAAFDDAQAAAPEPLNADELEILVARIALYPDDLVAVIMSASLFPLQVVEASRFLGQHEKDKSLKPKQSWDGSVISLLNYPAIVTMMSDDLEWTQQLGDAIAYQQKDLLVAIQQLREEAVARGIIKTDDKVKVTTDNDNVVIQPVNPEVVYVPQYEPEVLYVADYPPTPIVYYPDPYPNYYYPTAPFFAGVVTGAVWASVVDWDDWNVWGGRWDGGDIDIDCNNCFNNRDFNGKVNFNDVDWKNVDRSKIDIDRNQFTKLQNTSIKTRVERSGDTSIRSRATSVKKTNVTAVGNRTRHATDVRRSATEGLKKKGPDLKKPTPVRQDVKKLPERPPVVANRGGGNIDRPVGRPKPAGNIDRRPTKPAGLGTVDRGKKTKITSDRGNKAMGGGSRAGGGHKQVSRGGGRRR